jgi:formylglycine-generating enzyme required for sulfatase activity
MLRVIMLVSLILSYMGYVNAQSKAVQEQPNGSSVTSTKTTEFSEEFEWKGEKRTRKITKLNLGGEIVEFVYVPAGTFIMGSPELEKHNIDYDISEEKPQHRVTFTKAILVGKFTITKVQFEAFMKTSGHKMEANQGDHAPYGFNGKEFIPSNEYDWKNTGWKQTDQHPVVNVSYYDAIAYCEWATKQAKRQVRLLSEAEYEYTNRGGTTTRYFTGDDIKSLEGYANIVDRTYTKKFPDSGPNVDIDDGELFTSPVGKYKPNPFGLHDMTGNVNSWCADWYEEKLYGRGDVKDPDVNMSGEQRYRVIRGSCWISNEFYSRGAYRKWGNPRRRNSTDGFRICLPLEK